jgi:hypothetical protein
MRSINWPEQTADFILVVSNFIKQVLMQHSFYIIVTVHGVHHKSRIKSHFIKSDVLIVLFSANNYVSNGAKNIKISLKLPEI